MKKTLYDIWDNMFRIVIINLGFLAVVSIPVFLPVLAANLFDSLALEIILTALGILLVSVYLAAASLTIKTISDYGHFGFGDFIKNFKPAIVPGIVIGLGVFLLFIVFTVILPFYLSIESLWGLLLGAIVFWTTLFALLSFQYFFAVYGRLNNKVSKALKKCMIISLDNSGFSLFLLLYNLVGLVLSVVFVFIFPGPAGVLLCVDEGLRLRLLKYDYLEANPEADRRKIPWDALLIEERERTGSRTFRNFIFPWKD